MLTTLSSRHCWSKQAACFPSVHGVSEDAHSGDVADQKGVFINLKLRKGFGKETTVPGGPEVQKPTS